MAEEAVVVPSEVPQVVLTGSRVVRGTLDAGGMNLDVAILQLWIVPMGDLLAQPTVVLVTAGKEQIDHLVESAVKETDGLRPLADQVPDDEPAEDDTPDTTESTEQETASE